MITIIAFPAVLLRYSASYYATFPIHGRYSFCTSIRDELNIIWAVGAESADYSASVASKDSRGGVWQRGHSYMA
jgi:hypothetical protein